MLSVKKRRLIRVACKQLGFEEETLSRRHRPQGRRGVIGRADGRGLPRNHGLSQRHGLPIDLGSGDVRQSAGHGKPGRKSNSSSGSGRNGPARAGRTRTRRWTAGSRAITASRPFASPRRNTRNRSSRGAQVHGGAQGRRSPIRMMPIRKPSKGSGAPFAPSGWSCRHPARHAHPRAAMGVSPLTPSPDGMTPSDRAAIVSDGAEPFRNTGFGSAKRVTTLRHRSSKPFAEACPCARASSCTVSGRSLIVPLVRDDAGWPFVRLGRASLTPWAARSLAACQEPPA